MATGDLDVPQLVIQADMSDASDNPFSAAISHSSPLLDSSHLPPSSDNHGSPCLHTPSPILRSAPRSARNSIGSIRWETSTVLCDNNYEERDETSSYPPNPHDHRRRRGRGARTDSESAAEDNRRFKLQSRATRPEWTSTLPTVTDTRMVHVDASLDAETSAGSRPSFLTSFFRRTVRRVRRQSGESDTAVRNGGQKGENANARRKETQLARPAVLDLKPQQYSDLGFFQKKSITDNLKERLEATKKLHGEAVDLQMFYESGTVATMRNLRATGKSVPCGLQKQSIETLILSTPAATSTGQCRIQRGGLRAG